MNPIPTYLKAILASAFLLILFLLQPFGLKAQFSSANSIFTSEITYPTRVFGGDIDNDGDMDVLVQNNSPNYVNLYRNLGGGIFADPEAVLNLAIYNYTEPASVTDIDNDGDGDLTEGSLWYQNNGPGLFTAMGSYVPTGIVAANLLRDLDGDGDIDDVCLSGGNLVILVNDGTGIFSPGATLASGTGNSVRASYEDVNGDLVNDLIIGGDNSFAGWYAGTGSGNFGSRDTIDLFLSPATPSLNDVDGDGDKDLLAFNAAPGSRWWSNNGSGVFTFEDTISTDAAQPQVIADVDGDGDVDLSVNTGTFCNVTLTLSNNGTSWSGYNLDPFSGYSLQGTSYGNTDVDGDGDQDLMICHGLGIATWYPNLGGGQIGKKEKLAKVVSGGRDVSAADVDLDGDLDVAGASYYGDIVSLYLNNGNGTFATQEIIAKHCDKVSKVRFADLNVDGKPDLITNVPNCAVIWNNGVSWTPDTLPGQAVAYQVLDVDGDLDPDLICGSLWLENDGSGNFSAVPDADISVLNSVDTADVNGDGITDLVACDGDTITVMLNDGAGDFTRLFSPAIASKLDLADMDGDGDIDVVTMAANPMISIYFNDGTGLFSGVVQYTHPVGVSNNIMINDFDDDGDADVVWSHSNGYQHEMYVHRNLGPGILGPAELVDPAASVTYGMIMADMNNDAVQDLVIARFHQFIWKENFFFNAFRLRGSVFHDFNLDAVLDPSESKVPFQLVRSSANNVLVWTNSAGDYDVPADSGTFDVWTKHPAIYQVTNNPDTLIATLTVSQPIQDNLDFGMAPAVVDSGAFLTFTPAPDFGRCNMSSTLWFHVRNVGTFIPTNAVIDLTFHPDLTVNSFSFPPDSVAGNHYYFHIDSLGWFQEWFVYINITAGTAGTFSNISASLTWGQSPDKFTESIGGVVTCAFDPNDKMVTPAGYGTAGAVDINTSELTYTIRFQNTGNDTAYTVILVDTLDTDLDWTSLRILAASHPLTGIMVDGNGRATFRFDQIYLPDSIVDEPGSHGFVKYSIAPASGSPDGTTIYNSAAIYFDLNEPVITNTVLNTLIDCSLFSSQITMTGTDSLTASPGDIYQWFFNGDTLPGATNPWLIIDSIGSYTVSVINQYGCHAMSNVITIVGINENDASGFSLWPNPSDGKFIIESNEIIDAVELTDISGRILYSAAASKKSWTIDVSETVASGVYFIRAFTNGKQIAVRKIIVD